MKKLKSEDGPDLHVYGSGNLLQTLLKHDLADECRLKIYPVTLGPGKRLFAEGTIPAAFRLTESKASPSGVIVANYRRAGDVRSLRWCTYTTPEERQVVADRFPRQDNLVWDAREKATG